jgi:hypothetical protein
MQMNGETAMTISRETIIGDVSAEDERVQYDDRDTDRLTNVGDAVISHVSDFLKALDNYILALSAPADEDSKMNMLEARMKLVEAWAIATCALSKAGWIIRVDGDEAFQRTAEAIKTGKALNLSGL